MLRWNPPAQRAAAASNTAGNASHRLDQQLAAGPAGSRSRCLICGQTLAPAQRLQASGDEAVCGCGSSQVPLWMPRWNAPARTRGVVQGLVEVVRCACRERSPVERMFQIHSGLTTCSAPRPCCSAVLRSQPTHHQRGRAEVHLALHFTLRTV